MTYDLRQPLSTLILSLCLLPACAEEAEGTGENGSETGETGGGTGDGQMLGACAEGTRIGGFELSIEDEYTGLQGRVESAVAPFLIPELVAEEGSCAFYQPRSLFCDPPCSPGETCDAEGQCIEAPVAIGVGDVSVSGLGTQVEMTASAPAFFYTFTGTLEHPPFAAGDAITLSAAGDEEVDAFTLDSRGIEELDVSATSVALDEGVPLTLEWIAGSESSAVIHVDLNIALHGGTPGWIECEFPDTGSFELPVGLTDQLLGQGFSGFPALVVTRRSGDRVETPHGCVDFVTKSTRALAVDIEGLTSCSDDDDCTPPETCQADLTCG